MQNIEDFKIETIDSEELLEIYQILTEFINFLDTEITTTENMGDK